MSHGHYYVGQRWRNICLICWTKTNPRQTATCRRSLGYNGMRLENIFSTFCVCLNVSFKNVHCVLGSWWCIRWRLGSLFGEVSWCSVISKGWRSCHYSINVRSTVRNSKQLSARKGSTLWYHFEKFRLELRLISIVFKDYWLNVQISNFLQIQCGLNFFSADLSKWFGFY